jgi:hypothetical protein
MSKPKTEYGNFTFHEVAMIATIMGDVAMNKIYDKLGIGYIATADKIANWAIEFAKKHTKTNWEKVLEKGMKPLSKGVSEIICWDDAIIDFAAYKAEQALK